MLTKNKARTVKKTKSRKLYCQKCGLVITINRECDCADGCDLICCGRQLKEKK